MQQSVPARILAQKQVKYFNVASTIRRPRRLTELVWTQKINQNILESDVDPLHDPWLKS